MLRFNRCRVGNGGNWNGYGDLDCYVYRVRYHHAKRVKADQYDVHGLFAFDSVLETDITEKNGDGSSNIHFETFYVPKGATPMFGDTPC